MEKLTDFETSILEAWLTEVGIEAYLDGDEVVFDAPKPLSEYAKATTGNAALNELGVTLAPVRYSDAFRGMLIFQGLCAVDMANARIDCPTYRGLDATQHLARLGGVDIPEVYIATCHSVAPAVNAIFDRMYGDFSHVALLSQAVADHERGDR